MTYEELLTNVEFNQQVAAAKDAKEIVDLFAAKGIEVPMEIAQELFEQPAEADGELSAEALDNVAGGGAWGAALGGGCAYVISRLTGKSVAQSAHIARIHAYHGYTKLPF